MPGTDTSLLCVCLQCNVDYLSEIEAVKFFLLFVYISFAVADPIIKKGGFESDRPI